MEHSANGIANTRPRPKWSVDTPFSNPIGTLNESRGVDGVGWVMKHIRYLYISDGILVSDDAVI